MFAYQKKYNAENARLLYPMTQKVERVKPISYRANDGAQVHIEFIDLYDIRNSIDVLIDRMIKG